jgi:hypothetical protein
MHRTLRRTWWVLAVAFGMALAGPAIAQTSSFASGDLPDHMRRQGAQRPAAAQPNRPLEIQIELAWLGDPVTFPYHLAARVTATEVEVHGYVPSSAVREHALKIALQQAPLPVADLLKVNANLAEHPVHMKADHLKMCVINQLEKACPAKLSTVHVACNDQGYVNLTGSAASSEDKLAIAAQLRRVPGCSCVINEVRVQGTTDGLSAFVPTAIVPVANLAKKDLVARGPEINQWPAGSPYPLPSPAAPQQPRPGSSPYHSLQPPTLPAPVQTALPPQDLPTSVAGQDMVNGPGLAPKPYNPLAAQGPKAPVPCAPLGDPYVTTGIVVVSYLEQAPVTAAVPEGLASAIQRACGPAIHELRLERQNAKTILIHFSASNATEACQCWDKIQTLPELRTFDISADVHLQK